MEHEKITLLIEVLVHRLNNKTGHKGRRCMKSQVMLVVEYAVRSLRLKPPNPKPQTPNPSPPLPPPLPPPPRAAPSPPAIMGYSIQLEQYSSAEII